MKTTKLVLAALSASALLIGAMTVMPVQTRPQPASASQGIDLQGGCPAPTDKGAYHERGRDKDGNALCGFTYYNACPYFEGAEAGTPECEKGKPTPEQLEPWNPTEPAAQPEPTPNTCGGK